MTRYSMMVFLTGRVQPNVVISLSPLSSSQLYDQMIANYREYLDCSSLFLMFLLCPGIGFRSLVAMVGGGIC
jgi:hypothetical protein